MKRHITFVILTIFLLNLPSLCGCSDIKQTPVSKNSIDPFEGLVVEFNGVSPFCTISFNNARCSEEVQMNVEYSLEPNKIVVDKTFEINETCTVYALLKNPYDEEQKYTLSQTSKDYVVKDVPAYITEISDEMDLSHLNSEIQDYVESITAFSNSTNLREWKVYDSLGASMLYKDSRNLQENKRFFSSLKMSSYDKYSSNEFYFNKIDVTYSIDLMGHYDTSFQNRYFTVTAKNIVQYPDGKITWGLENPNVQSLEYNVDTSMESLINTHITFIKTDYNVSQITEF